jgi:superfamily II helicase
MSLEVICAWCLKDAKETGQVGKEISYISHGICSDCAEKLLEQAKIASQQSSNPSYVRDGALAYA